MTNEQLMDYFNNSHRFEILMPSNGLALIGFMDAPQAVAYLQKACVPIDPDPQILVAEWARAKAALGLPVPNAGHPDIQPLSAMCNRYIQDFVNEPWVIAAFKTPDLQGISFRAVEIDPLLALQFHVDCDRSDHHCKALPQPPNELDLLPACLPRVQPDEQFQTSPVLPFSQSVMIKSRNVSLQQMGAGIFPLAIDGFATRIAGMQFHLSLPFVHVVRFNGKCYPHNGFHRAYGARLAGATHVPCLFRDVPTPESVGIRQDGLTFNLPLLESADPPTLMHFTQGRAHTVRLRAISRILHVTWSQYVFPDE